MKRAQIGQTITTVPVIIVIALVLGIFIILSMGVCLLGRCDGKEISVDFESSPQVRAEAEFFLTERVEFLGSDVSIRNLLTNWSLTDSDSRILLAKEIEKSFSDLHKCEGLAIIYLKSGQRPEIYIDYPNTNYLENYPSTDSNRREELLHLIGKRNSYSEEIGEVRVIYYRGEKC